MTNIEDVSFTEILTTPLGESWTHHCCLGGNPHFLQKLTENALVGLVTFFRWLTSKIVFSDPDLGSKWPPSADIVLT